MSADTSAVKPWLDPNLVGMLDDLTLRRAFERTSGPDDPEAAVILAEIIRRGLEA